MNISKEKMESSHPVVSDRREDVKSIGVIEHGIKIQADYGYVRAAGYLFQNGIKWPVIQRVLRSHICRRTIKKENAQGGEALH
ncbi:MAG: hypothetical protein FWG01_04890 [Betaproteobacteria bacterium]|nr:hypothetical protein [Betaproteobacteria bacterium]